MRRWKDFFEINYYIFYGLYIVIKWCFVSLYRLIKGKPIQNPFKRKKRLKRNKDGYIIETRYNEEDYKYFK